METDMANTLKDKIDKTKDKFLEIQVAVAEEKLRIAMMNSDVNTLDKIMDPDLILTNNLGQITGKEFCLSKHTANTKSITQLNYSEHRIMLLGGNVAVVSVRAQIHSDHSDQESERDFRFTRVWALSTCGNWKVIAAHVGAIHNLAEIPSSPSDGAQVPSSQ